ncbi:MAG: TolC family protein [Thermoanaerobaculia bacterium]
MYTRTTLCLLAVALLGSPAIGQQTDPDPSYAPPGEASPSVPIGAPADRILRAESDAQLAALIEDALTRNPGVAAATAEARAAEHRSVAVGALPDPTVGIIAFLQSPETRTGPQVLTLNLLQELPWLSKLDLEEQAALLTAVSLQADVEAKRLALVTEVRRLYFELAFLTRQKEITIDFLDHLRQHEEISRSRYATGMGTSQGVIKIQAEITSAESQLLDLDQRRIDLEAQLNNLRDRPDSAVILPPDLPRTHKVHLDYDDLLDTALLSRPELAAADARIAASGRRIERAEKSYRPNFKVGLTYTFVDPREDPAGVALPPAGNGDDIFGIQGGVSIPFWRQSLAARVDEATQLELAAQEDKRQTVAAIQSSIGELMQRIPLSWQQLHLLEDILILQAEESVASAQSGYVTGTLNALDLLDAEHVLYRTQTSSARAQADYAILLARLEGETTRPLSGQPRSQ